MYIYHLELTPAKKFINLDYLSYENLLYEACNYITSGLAFTRDNKCISITKIEKEKICVTLTSKCSLQNPARSLSALTRYLTSNYSQIFKDYVYNKTLFKMELIATETEGNEELVITDELLLKTLIDLLYFYPAKSESETQLRNKTVMQMKEMIKPFIWLIMYFHKEREPFCGSPSVPFQFLCKRTFMV